MQVQQLGRVAIRWSRHSTTINHTTRGSISLESEKLHRIFEHDGGAGPTDAGAKDLLG